MSVTKRVGVCVCVCVYVSVLERESVRERERGQERYCTSVCLHESDITREGER